MFRLLLIMAVFAFSGVAPTKVASATSTPAAKQINFSVFDIGKKGVPKPTALERELIRIVLHASDARDRPNLMFTYVDNRELLLYYGDPKHPDGREPQTKTTLPHVLGESCMLRYSPATGERRVRPPSDCSMGEPSRADLAIIHWRQEQPTTGAASGPAPKQINFSVFDIGKRGIPKPTAAQRDLIRAVLKVSDANDRPNLMFTYVDSHEFLLYYGDPQHPDGRDAEGNYAGYHVLGETCMALYEPARGERIVSPPRDCEGPIRADRAIMQWRQKHGTTVSRGR